MSICRSLHRRMGFSDTIFSGPVYWKESVTFYKGDANKLKDEVMSTSYGARGSIRGWRRGGGRRAQATGRRSHRAGKGGARRGAAGRRGVCSVWKSCGGRLAPVVGAKEQQGEGAAGKRLDVWGWMCGAHARARGGSGPRCDGSGRVERRLGGQRSGGQAVRRSGAKRRRHRITLTTPHSLTTHPSPHTHSPASSCVFLRLPDSVWFDRRHRPGA